MSRDERTHEARLTPVAAPAVTGEHGSSTGEPATALLAVDRTGRRALDP